MVTVGKQMEKVVTGIYVTEHGRIGAREQGGQRVFAGISSVREHKSLENREEVSA